MASIPTAPDQPVGRPFFDSHTKLSECIGRRLSYAIYHLAALGVLSVLFLLVILHMVISGESTDDAFSLMMIAGAFNLVGVLIIDNDLDLVRMLQKLGILVETEARETLAAGPKHRAFLYEAFYRSHHNFLASVCDLQDKLVFLIPQLSVLFAYIVLADAENWAQVAPKAHLFFWANVILSGMIIVITLGLRRPREIDAWSAVELGGKHTSS